MKDSLLIFKLYRWAYDLTKMPDSWMFLILGLILLPLFILIKPFASLTRLIPAFNTKRKEKSWSRIHDMIADSLVSMFILLLLFGLILIPIHITTGAKLFNNTELTNGIINVTLFILVSALWIGILISIYFLIAFFIKYTPKLPNWMIIKKFPKIKWIKKENK